MEYMKYMGIILFCALPCVTPIGLGLGFLFFFVRRKDPKTGSVSRRSVGQYVQLPVVIFVICLLWFLLELVARRKRSGKELFKLARESPTSAITMTTLSSTRLKLSNGETKHIPDEDGTKQMGHEASAAITPSEIQDEIGEPLNTPHCSASTKLYDYAPLVGEDIRLLQILPSQNEESPIQANMLHVALQSATRTSFTALSYTWGSQNATDTIIVDQMELKIRSNLAAILRRMRGIGHHLVWVDAICINQENIEERNTQVYRMRNIYATAQTVLVAIDVAECDLTNVMRVFSLANTALLIDNQSKELRDLLRDGSIQASLVSFCSNKYWGRIWIVQEFAIGTRVEFLLGNTTFEWGKLEILFKLLEDSFRPTIKSQAEKVIQVRQSWQNNQGLFLLDILVALQTSKCGDRHDRVYGLLGVTTDTQRYAIEPNYALGFDEISLSMTQQYIRKGSLDIMLLSSHREPNQGLPTWSPDFFRFDSSPADERVLRTVLRDRRQPYEGETNIYHPLNSVNIISDRLQPWAVAVDVYGIREGAGFSAWKFSDATTGVGPQVAFDGNVLRSQARRIGSIISLGRAWSDPPESDYPMHSATTVQGSKRQNVRTSLSIAVRAILYSKYMRSNIRGYCWLRVFLCDYMANCDAESPQSNMVRWLWGNRKFFAAGYFLEEHAAKLWHPFFSCGLLAWRRALFFSPNWPFVALENAASEDMRLMCLDDDSFGIGWAVKRARLCDEVFLLPGCSRPVILRRTEHGKYAFIGDAIVGGIMQGELWKETKDEHLTEVEIV